VLLPKILILIVLIFVFVQDIISRSVYWFLFPVLIALFIAIHHLSGGYCHQVLINIGFLIFQFLILSVYFSLKNKHWINITDNYLGWGDLLFLISIGFYLSVLNYLFFYLFSLITVLLAWLIWEGLSKKKDKQIPLAGLQALLFILFLGLDWWVFPLGLTNDDWLLQLFNK